MRRIITALLLLLICLPSVAEAARRPVLRVFVATWCAACKEFDRDLKAGGPEVDALRARFTIEYVDVDRPLNKLLAGLLPGIKYVPAFQAGGVIHYGYCGMPDLLQRLGIAAVVPRPDPKFTKPSAVPPATPPSQSVPADPPADRPPHTSPPALQPSDPVCCDELAAQLERIGDGIEERLAFQLNGVRAGLQESQRRSTEQTAAALRQVEAELNLLRSIEPTPGPDLSHVEQSLTEQRSLLQRIVSGVGKAAAPAAPESISWLRVAEVALGSSPYGLAAMGGLWALRRLIRRRSDSASQPVVPSAPVAVEAPQVPAELLEAIGTLTERIKALEHAGHRPDDSEIVHLRAQLAELKAAMHAASARPDASGRGVARDTEYVPIPTVDAEAEALKEAMRRETVINPDLKGIFARIESAAADLVHGKRILDRSPVTGRPWLKSD